jgi:hypothetical protein
VFATLPSYRATLSDSSEKVVWRSNVFLPASPDALGTGVASTVFAPGLYTLTLEGVEATGSLRTFARFGLRAVNARLQHFSSYRLE